MEDGVTLKVKNQWIYLWKFLGYLDIVNTFVVLGGHILLMLNMCIIRGINMNDVVFEGLEEGEYICPECKGKGSIEFYMDEYKICGWKGSCPICEGKGKLDWIVYIKHSKEYSNDSIIEVEGMQFIKFDGAWYEHDESFEQENVSCIESDGLEYTPDEEEDFDTDFDEILYNTSKYFDVGY